MHFRMHDAEVYNQTHHISQFLQPRVLSLPTYLMRRHKERGTEATSIIKLSSHAFVAITFKKCQLNI